jgi:catechol 2,3-dioxygenase
MTAAAFTISPPRYRLPDDMRLGVVRLQVADLERSIEYYERVIGLRVLSKDGARAALGPMEEDVVLVELNERKGATPVPRRGRLGLYHFAILLPDRGSLARFARHLVDIGENPGMADHLVSEAFYLTDPDGLGIEVYADRPRESWRVTNGTLAMATDPIDMDSLMSEEGDVRWAGAPKGTRIGHVHLYVSDIAQSGAFFHEALGLDRIALAFPGALFMSAGGYHHHLGTNTWAAGAPLTAPDDAQLLEWTLHLPSPDDVDAAAASLTGAGHAVRRDGGDAVAADPWGTHIRITTP